MTEVNRKEEFMNCKTIHQLKMVSNGYLMKLFSPCWFYGTKISDAQIQEYFMELREVLDMKGWEWNGSCD